LRARMVKAASASGDWTPARSAVDPPRAKKGSAPREVTRGRDTNECILRFGGSRVSAAPAPRRGHGKARRSGAALVMCLLLSGALVFCPKDDVRVGVQRRGGSAQRMDTTREALRVTPHNFEAKKKILVTSNLQAKAKYNDTTQRKAAAPTRLCARAPSQHALLTRARQFGVDTRRRSVCKDVATAGWDPR
jgi:hypothetical protein